ncbi:MAG TPA: hypothetical protein PLP17_13490, partial [Oligoflexia bacterium]|nr:hypothetical protein [Oligoflexia bacterium]
MTAGLQTESQLAILRLLGWFYTQMGRPGVVLAALSAIACVVWLVAWQMRRQGRVRVAKVYGVILVCALCLHFAFPEVETGQGAAAQPSIEEAAKLDLLNDKLASQKIPSVRSAVAAPEKNESSEESWLKTYGMRIGFWVVAIAVALYLLRVRPEWLNPTKFSRLLQGSKAWIRPQRSANNELGSSDLASFAEVKRWFSPHGKYDTRLAVADLRGSSGIMLKKGDIIIPVGERNRHMLIIAKTGGGKTTKMILPILYNDCMCPHRSTIVI